MQEHALAKRPRSRLAAQHQQHQQQHIILAIAVTAKQKWKERSCGSSLQPKTVREVRYSSRLRRHTYPYAKSRVRVRVLLKHLSVARTASSTRICASTIAMLAGRGPHARRPDETHAAAPSSYYTWWRFRRRRPLPQRQPPPPASSASRSSHTQDPTPRCTKVHRRAQPLAGPRPPWRRHPSSSRYPQPRCSREWWWQQLYTEQSPGTRRPRAEIALNLPLRLLPQPELLFLLPDRGTRASCPQHPGRGA